jgi:hypothetical protein
MSPIIDLPIFLYDPEIQKAEIYKFLDTLETSRIEITEIIPDSIWRVKVNFKYKREWKIFCCQFWGNDYFEKHINKK